MLQWRLQPPFHVQHHPFLVGVGLHRLDDQVMRNVVKEPGDVTIQYPRVRKTTPSACLNRIQLRAARPIPVRAAVEHRLHHLLQLHRDHRLRHSISHGRNAQHAHATAMRLGHLDSLHRRRKVASRGHPIPRHIQPVPQIGLQILDRAPVHTRSTLVCLHLPKPFYHRMLRDRKRLVCRFWLVHRTPPSLSASCLRNLPG
jgi:hypothetical protein